MLSVPPPLVRAHGSARRRRPTTRNTGVRPRALLPFALLRPADGVLALRGLLDRFDVARAAVLFGMQLDHRLLILVVRQRVGRAFAKMCVDREVVVAGDRAVEVEV